MLPNFLIADLQALASKESSHRRIPFPILTTTNALLSYGPAKEVFSASTSAFNSSGDINAVEEHLKSVSSPTITIPSPTNIVSPVSPMLPEQASSLEHLCPIELQLDGRKFKLKFSPLELETNPLQHAVVFISDSVLPNCVYIQFKDEDFPRYHQMLRDLELVFSFASGLALLNYVSIRKPYNSAVDRVVD